MATEIYITNNTEGDLNLSDIGYIIPLSASDLDLMSMGYNDRELRESIDLQQLITSEYLTAKDENGIVFTDLEELVSIDLVSDCLCASSTSESSTNSQVWQDKLELVANNLTENNYKIEWHCLLSSSNTNKMISARLLHNNETQIDYTELCKIYPAGETYYQTVGGFIILVGISGNHTFKIQYKTINNNHTAYIKNVFMLLTRTT